MPLIARTFGCAPGEEASAIGGLGLLNFSILDRCHKLLGRPDVPVAKQLSAGLQRSEAIRLLHIGTVRDIEVGDFVLAYGDLAEVLEIRESRYAYRSYRVRYLAEKPKPTIQEDWFPARYVQRFYTKEQFRSGLDRLVSEGKLPSDIAASAVVRAGGFLASGVRSARGSMKACMGIPGWISIPILR